MTDIAKQDPATILEMVVVGGDLSKLAPAQRLAYYDQVCKSLGLNPLTKPFQYLTLNGRMVLYATRDCTDQLRKLHRVNVRITSRERMDDVYVVTALASLPDGRTDESIGAVNIGNLKGDPLANAIMKSETKAKRRATLSIVGLGWLDETEIETVPDARIVNEATGEITAPEQPAVTTAVPPPPATARSFYTCSQCHTTIQAYKKRDGSLLSAKSIAESSVEQFHAQLCLDCARKVKAGTLVLDMPGEGDADDEGDMAIEEARAEA